MDLEVKKEIRGRTLKLDAHEKEKALIDEAELKLKRLYAQTHETVNGRRVKLTKRRKIAKAKKLLDVIFDGQIDVSVDTINMIRLMDGDA